MYWFYKKNDLLYVNVYLVRNVFVEVNVKLGVMF